jgi:prephenate dehydrogenase
MSFRQVTIFGVGLLGGSLGLALKQRRLADRIVGVGHRQSTLDAAVARGAIDRGTTRPAEGVAGSDLVVLATPVGRFGPLLTEAAPALAPGCLITDVGSTKRAVVEAVTPIIPPQCRFVASHPLAGSEARGIDAARADLYLGALVLVTPTPAGDEPSVQRIEQLWQALGCRTRRLDAAMHDRLLAQTSHLPHLAASLLVEALSVEAADLVSTGFLDTTRVASGDPAMWRDIFMTNRDEVLRAVERLEAALAEAKAALTSGDGAAMEALLQRAKIRRDQLRSGR